MMFTKADRDNLAAVKILLVQHVHETMGATGKEELFAKLDALAESQGKLLAAIHDLGQRGGDAEAWAEKQFTELAARVIALDRSTSAAIGNAFLNFERKVKQSRPKRKKGKR